MRIWHSAHHRVENAAKAEVSAWLEQVSDQLDDELAENEVERGVNLYRQKVQAPGDELINVINVADGPDDALTASPRHRRGRH